MIIRTNAYEIDFAEFRRVMVRTCYRRLCWFLLILVAMALGLMVWGLVGTTTPPP